MEGEGAGPHKPGDERERPEAEQERHHAVGVELARDAGEEQHGGEEDRRQHVVVGVLIGLGARGELGVGLCVELTRPHERGRPILVGLERGVVRLRVLERVLAHPCAKGGLELVAEEPLFEDALEEPIAVAEGDGVLGEESCVDAHQRVPLRRRLG
jgi:hypothetical protein